MWCRYQRIPPDTLMMLRYDTSTAYDSNVSGNQFPTRTTVQFTGRVRVIPAGRKEFLGGYARFFRRPDYDTLFHNEVELKRPNGIVLWVPIQTQMLPQFRSEVSPGDSTTVFLLWAGVDGRVSRPAAWVFLINEFTSRASREFWSQELASCHGN